MGNDTALKRRIVNTCNSLHLEQDIVFARAEILIKNYHEIMWADSENPSLKNTGHDAASQKDAAPALLYLADFDPYGDVKDISGVMLALFETQWIKDLVGAALEKVMAYSEDGRLHCSILNNELSQEYITRRARQKAIGIGHTAFYRKLDEAILLFGIVLWGKIIPYWLDMLHLTECRPKKLRVAETDSPGLT